MTTNKNEKLREVKDTSTEELGWKAIAVLHQWMRTEADEQDAQALGEFILSERREAAEEALRKDGEMAALVKVHAGEEDFEKYVRHMVYPSFVIKAGLTPEDMGEHE